MNLFLRLLRVIIHAFFRPQMDIMDTSVVSFTVWPHDLDINIHMTNSRYLSLMDLGRTDIFIRTGLATKSYKRKWLPVLGASTIRWRKALNLFDKIQLETRALGWEDKWFYFEQRFVCKGITHAVAIMKVALVGKRGTVPCQQVVDLVEPGRKSPRLPHSVKIWVELEEEMRNRLKDKS
jgi:acyl-CoA thioesterase FadM